MPRAPLSEKDGVACLNAPDTVARPTIAEIYSAQFDYVYRCLGGLGVRADSIDDALQDVFLVVQRKLSAFDGRSQLRTWLYAIVLRVARRYRERNAKDARRFVTEGDNLCTEGEQVLLHNERLALAQRALGALDPPKREVFVLSLVEQFSAPEVAEIMRLPLNTVYSRLRAARAAFAQEVARLQRRTQGRQP